MEQYYGTYRRFDTESKNEGALLLGADNLVGDVFEIDFATEDGKARAWMKNKFGRRVAFFDAEFSRKLSVFEARGWAVKALLSFVAYSDTPEPGIYWGEAAIICYNPSISSSVDRFAENLSRHLSEGVRPDVALGKQAAENLVSSNGDWIPKKRVPLPEKTKGSAIVKSRRSASEKLIEQGRKGNKGCYLLSILFFAALIALAAFGLKSCGVF